MSTQVRLSACSTHSNVFTACLESAMRMGVAAFALSFLASTALAAQSQRAFGLRLGVRLPVGRVTHAATICDGSEMQSVENRRSMGKVLFVGGLGAMLVAPATVGSSYSTATSLLSIGAIASSLGAYMHYYSHPSEEFWQSTVSKLKVGETKSAQVEECLRKPSATSIAGSEATWTYYVASPGLLGLGGSSQSLDLTFQNGILASVRRTGASF